MTSYCFISATRGVLPAVTGNGAYMIIPVVPPQRTNLDRMRIAFQTYAKDGPIARFMSQNGQFYEIYMVSFWGIISMDFNLQIRAGILAMGCCRASQKLKPHCKVKLSLYVGIVPLRFSPKILLNPGGCSVGGVAVVNSKSCGKVSRDIVVSLTAHLLFIIFPPHNTKKKRRKSYFYFCTRFPHAP